MRAALLGLGAQHLGDELRRAGPERGAGSQPGCCLGRFAHNTGEGGFSRYHREPGGDIVWQIGTGYFGCRAPDGSFSIDLFEQHASEPQVKMIEIKLSQGARPGHGGVLPGAKVTEEIAAARGVPEGETCFSPTYHSAFSSPVGLLEMISRLRQASGGKPVGFKLCVGDPSETFSVFKAMAETGLYPDFVTVDGAEGGTGAAPLEFSDHVGTPLIEALVLVRNTLVRIGALGKVKLAASGKRLTAFDMAVAHALGADWCNQARGFMLALGCIQSQRCDRNDCPVGVATQDPSLQRALVVPLKADRVHAFHARTVEALAELVAACGLEHPSQLRPHHLWQRVSETEVASYESLYALSGDENPLRGFAHADMSRAWERARPDRFTV